MDLHSGAMDLQSGAMDLQSGAMDLGQVGALCVHCERTACSADTMKPSQGGREETTLHLCRHHKGLHILGDWWLWPSTTCCCVSVLEDGGSLLET